jgi:hypothetical protein
MQPWEFKLRISIGISLGIQVVAGANSCNGRGPEIEVQIKVTTKIDHKSEVQLILSICNFLKVPGLYQELKDLTFQLWGAQGFFFLPKDRVTLPFWFV